MNDHWEIISSRRLSASGELISTAAFRPSGWYPASVPGTVLGSLVKDSVYRDIFYDRNLEKIPDSLFAAPWWYRTRFSLGKFLAGQVTRLVFNGINYRAEIWLNGHRVARDDTTRGGFSRFILDVSGWVQPGENVLAVRIARPGPGDLTLGFVDWNPTPPDHNMGLWRDVRLKLSGPVSVDRPYVRTVVDTPSLERAQLTVSATLTNHALHPVTGILSGVITGGIRFSRRVSLGPGDTREVVFTPRRIMRKPASATSAR